MFRCVIQSLFIIACGLVVLGLAAVGSLIWVAISELLLVVFA